MEGIGKLIELLREYDEYRGEKRRNYGWTKNKVELDVKMIIFKKYGFIKWLVDNDKIDKKKFEDEFFVCGCCGYKLLSTRETCEACGDEVLDVYEALLMRLAIQDEPLTFLISILK